MWCNIGWHSWGRWSRPMAIPVGWYVFGIKIGDTRPGWEQVRTCKRCGKYETRLGSGTPPDE